MVNRSSLIIEPTPLAEFIKARFEVPRVWRFLTDDSGTRRRVASRRCTTIGLSTSLILHRFPREKIHIYTKYIYIYKIYRKRDEIKRLRFGPSIVTMVLSLLSVWWGARAKMKGQKYLLTICILKANEGLSEVALKNAMYKGISKEEMMSTNKISYNC